jgi:hypothetical protein
MFEKFLANKFGKNYSYKHCSEKIIRIKFGKNFYQNLVDKFCQKIFSQNLFYQA